jgi:hypothetical protein
MPRALESRAYRDNPIGKRVSAPQIGQRHQRDRGPQERNDAKGNGSETAQQQQPPILRQSAEDGASERHLPGLDI